MPAASGVGCRSSPPAADGATPATVIVTSRVVDVRSPSNSAGLVWTLSKIAEAVPSVKDKPHDRILSERLPPPAYNHSSRQVRLMLEITESGSPEYSTASPSASTTVNSTEAVSPNLALRAPSRLNLASTAKKAAAGRKEMTASAYSVASENSLPTWPVQTRTTEPSSKPAVSRVISAAPKLSVMKSPPSISQTPSDDASWQGSLPGAMTITSTRASSTGAYPSPNTDASISRESASSNSTRSLLPESVFSRSM